MDVFDCEIGYSSPQKSLTSRISLTVSVTGLVTEIWRNEKDTEEMHNHW